MARNKKSRRGGMLGLLYLRQGSGVTPDSGKTVLRSRLGLNYGQLPASELAPRTCRCRNRLMTGYGACGIGSSRRNSFLSRQLSFRRLLWFEWRREARGVAVTHFVCNRKLRQ